MWRACTPETKFVYESLTLLNRSSPLIVPVMEVMQGNAALRSKLVMHAEEN